MSSAVRPSTARRPRSGSRAAQALPWLLAAATVAAQVAYPLVDGAALRRTTIAVVVLFFLASVTHAAVTFGGRWAVVLVVVAAGGGLAAEAVGVRTGIPFGSYRYDRSLGPSVFGVPLVVPLAWAMMAYPVLLAARRVSRRWAVPLGGLGLAGWDVFLDPQMVADGRWHWADPSPGLPGVPDVPLTNYAGWLVVGTVLMSVLDAALPRRTVSVAQPGALLLWTWLGSLIGNLFWFGSPSIALAGGLAMGLLTVPYLWSLWQSRR